MNCSHVACALYDLSSQLGCIGGSALAGRTRLASRAITHDRQIIRDAWCMLHGAPRQQKQPADMACRRVLAVHHTISTARAAFFRFRPSSARTPQLCCVRPVFTPRAQDRRLCAAAVAEAKLGPRCHDLWHTKRLRATGTSHRSRLGRRQPPAWPSKQSPKACTLLA